MTNEPLHFTLWDVRRGISIWIRTPNGQDHWIDLGRIPEFSPSKYVRKNHSIGSIELLIISRAGKTHLEDLPSFKDHFSYPSVLYRNPTIPEAEIFGGMTHKYQKQYAELHRRFNWPGGDDNPERPSNNGGIRYAINCLDHGSVVSNPALPESAVIENNNTSIVVMLLYAGVLFVCPGDIEPLGWREQWHHYSKEYKYLINHSHARFLVAPQRGHKDAYCEEMMEAIQPHATFINDVWGESEIHPSYKSDPIGILYRESGMKKYFSTRRAGSVRVAVYPSGEHCILQRS